MLVALKRWLWKSGRLEITILSSIFLVVVGVWAFAALAAEVMEGDTQKFDDRVLLAFRQKGNPEFPIGPRWTLQVARDLTAFGGAAGLGLVTAVVAGYLWLERRYGLLRYVCISVFGGTVLALILKQLFHRTRPQLVSHLTDISTASFPSGHSMLSSVTYLTLAALLARAAPKFWTKVYFLFVASALTVAIGTSRVYLGVHYPTDVFAGWALGSAWALLCSLVADFIVSRRLLPEADELSDAKALEEEGRLLPEKSGPSPMSDRFGPTGT